MTLVVGDGVRWTTDATFVKSAATIGLFMIKNIWAAVRHPRCYVVIRSRVNAVKVFSSSEDGGAVGLA